MTHIDLRQNKIEQISVGAFEDQKNLQFLYLKLNKLTRIEVGTFDSLGELKELWLQENQILLIEKGLFDQNTKLENLYLDSNKIITIESTVFENLNAIKSLTLYGNLCIDQDFTSNKLFQNFECFKKYKSLFKPYLDVVDECRSEKEFTHRDSKTKTYILLAVTTIEFSIIIILLWKLKSKNGVESSQGEPQIAVEGNPNENNLIYAALDLKPSNRTPIKSDKVIYSELQKVDRPNESAKK